MLEAMWAREWGWGPRKVPELGNDKIKISF